MTVEKAQDDKALLAFEFPDPEEKDGEVKQIDLTAEQETKEEPATVVETKKEEELPTDDDGPTPEELAQYSEAVQKRIKALTWKRHEEARARERAEQERQELQSKLNETLNRVQQLEKTASAGENAVVIQAQKLAETELERAKENLTKAYNEGDAAQFITAQEAFTEAQLKLSRIKAYVSQNPLQRRAEGGNVQPQQEPNPTTQAETKPAPSEKLKAWLADNKWFGKDKVLTNFARGLHVELMGSGVNPESDHYYETLTERTRSAFPEAFGGQKPHTGAAREKTTTVVAPAGRTTSPRRVVLNERQVALANRLGIPVAEYAKQLMQSENGNG